MLVKNDVIDMALFDLGFFSAGGEVRNRISQLVDAAIGELRIEGLPIQDDRFLPTDAQIVSMYVCYLYERRKLANNPMPRMLRWAINNRLFSYKTSGVSGYDT